MYVLKWSAKVKTPPYLSEVYVRPQPQLVIVAHLVCPVCQHNQEHSSRIELSPGEIRERRNLGWLVDRLADGKHCQSCGVESEVPKTLRNELFAEIQAAVTSEWMDRSVRELGCEKDTGHYTSPSPGDHPYTAPIWVVPKIKEEKEVVLTR